MTAGRTLKPTEVAEKLRVEREFWHQQFDDLVTEAAGLRRTAVRLRDALEARHKWPDDPSVVACDVCRLLDDPEVQAL